MESKRKASAASAHDAAPNTPDRATKRRKVMEEYGDLSNGESAESTTAYGLIILESIRATTDKNGRSVSPYFEKLVPRAENPRYYKQIRLPLCLEIIEQKLREGSYPTLSSLESDYKRLVQNAKETHDRNSTIFGDAERVRKAVSNLMVKHNPAYKGGDYTAVPTPLPPTPEPEDGEDEDADGEADVDHAASNAAGTEPASQGEDEVEGVGEGEDEQDPGDDEEEQEDENSDNVDEEPSSRRRRGSSRAQPESGDRKASTPARNQLQRGAKADHYFENVPFKDLSFQQAQEKLVEELIRKKDAADYRYFEPFFNLPSRELKDYYEVIAEPLSLKGLQKQVRGQLGRRGATYVSVFKSWAAFEDQASLIWKNAYHYNEDGSEIFVMAQELEEMFHGLLKEAKTNVPEPQQPKIKLKLPATTETPAQPVPKKLIIHVGGKSSATGSPAPPTARPGDGEVTRTSTPMNRNPFGGSSSAGAQVNTSQLEKARSMSASAGPPSPSTKAAKFAKSEDAAQPTAARALPTPTTFHHFAPLITPTTAPVTNGNGVLQQATVTPQVLSLPPPPPPAPKKSAADILEARKYRPRAIQLKDALMPKLMITSHPQVPVEAPLAVKVFASATEFQQEVVLNAPSAHFRIQIKPHIAAFLETQHREWKLNVLLDGQRQYPSHTSFDKRGEPVFDAQLRYGLNRIEVTVVAALPKGETDADGLSMELERVVIHLNLLRH
ncbi:Bromodomain-containing protein [Xylariaceae sp. FL1019]|nr:Bromodomain-containing protein [Xylariaceae sp. FL1019]